MPDHSSSTHFKKVFSLLTLVLIFLGGIAQGQRPVLTLPIGHQQPVHSIDFSPDGKLMVTGSLDNIIILWDLKTGFIIRRIKTEGPVQQVLFTPDGNELIVITGQTGINSFAKQKNQITKWEVRTGKMISRFPFTASPGIRFLRAGYMLVPDYSEDMTGANNSLLEKMRNQSDKADEDDDKDDAEDEKNAELMSEQIKKRLSEMSEKDRTDPKKMMEIAKEATREAMGKAMDKKGGPLSLLKKTFTLVDPKSLKVLASSGKSPEGLSVLNYNGKEYLVVKSETALYTGKGDMNMIDVADWIAQIKQGSKNVPSRDFKVGYNFMHSAASSGTKGFLCVQNERNSVQLLQIDRPDPVAEFKTKGMTVDGMEFSPDGNTLYIFSHGVPTRYIEAWNTGNHAQIFSYQLPARFRGEYAGLVPGGDGFLVDQGYGLVRFSLSGDSVYQYMGKSNFVNEYQFNEQDNAITITYNEMQDNYDMMRSAYRMEVDREAAAAGKKLTEKEREDLTDEKMKSLPLSNDRNAYKGFALDWDLQHGGAHVVPVKKNTTAPKIVSLDGNYSLSNEQFKSSTKDAGEQVNMALEASKKNKDNDEETKKSLEMVDKLFSKNGEMGKLLNTEAFNSPLTLLVNRKTSDTLSLICIDSTDWIMLNRKGYYMTSKNGARSLSYTSGLRVMPFEQFDIQYNRPDIVLRGIGKTDPTLIEAYRKAWEKRVRKLGIDTAQFGNDYNMPEADFGNRESINRDQKTGKLSLTIVGSDRKSNLDRFNVWINDVPAFGKNGKSVKGAASKNLNTTIEVTLSQGLNRIETSVMNANGAESYRTPLLVNYTPAQPVKEKVYFIGIGINRFADSSHNLQYCEKDIRDLSQKLEEKYGTSLSVDLLFNNDVTIGNVKALKQKLEQSAEDDKVIIAYSGHGLLSNNYDYYLSTYDVNFSQPEKNGLAYEELENLVDGIRSRKKLMLIDACHSGELDKDDLQRIAVVQDELKKNSTVVSGGKGINPGFPRKLGTKNSFELMQELFVNVGRGTGTTIISAAAGTQFALERGDLKNGVFTYSILELLNSGRSVTVNELKRHVGKRVSELTKGLQQPTARNEMQSVDWIVW